MKWSFLTRFLPARLHPFNWATRRYLRWSGLVVKSGPFCGLRYIPQAHCSALAPKIAGSYERELHLWLERLFAGRPDVFIDVGAAEGYYAVGAAVAGWQKHIIAYESDPHARSAFRELMKRNQFATKSIDLRGACEPAALQDLLEGFKNPALLMDVEGYEIFLLDPLRIPALGRCTLLVEHHDFVMPGLRDAIVSRMTTTHTVKFIEQESRSASELACADPLFCLMPAGVRRQVLNEHRPLSHHGWIWFEPRLHANPHTP